MTDTGDVKVSLSYIMDGYGKVDDRLEEAARDTPVDEELLSMERKREVKPRVRPFVSLKGVNGKGNKTHVVPVVGIKGEF